MCEHLWHEQANVDSIWSDFLNLVQGLMSGVLFFLRCVGTTKNEDVHLKITDGLMM